MKPLIFIVDPYPIYGYGLKELIRMRMSSYQTLVFSELDPISHYATSDDLLILFVDLFIAVTQPDHLNHILSHYPLCTLVLTTPETAFLKHVNLSSVRCHHVLSKTASEVDLNVLLEGLQPTEATRQTMKTPWKEIKSVGHFDLSPRDLELLSLLAQGLTNREIGDKLYLAEKTIKNNLTRLYARIQVQNRVEATRFALSHGLGKIHKSQP